MATFIEICEAVLEEADGRVTSFPSVDLGTTSGGEYYITDPTQRNIVRWTNEVYLQIQQQMIQADFMHKRGLFITTTSGVSDYTKTSVREVNAHSVYATPSGSVGRTPVYVSSYDDWVQSERFGSETDNGSPLWLIRMPNEKWKLDPVPSGTWLVYADWWLEPAKFETADEEPVWDESYHDLLKWKVLGLFAAEFQNEGSGPILRDRIQQMLPPLESAFKRRYVPAIRPPSPLL